MSSKGAVVVPVAAVRTAALVTATAVVVAAVPAAALAAATDDGWGDGVVRLPEAAIGYVAGTAAAPDGSVVAVGAGETGATVVRVSPDGTQLRSLATPPAGTLTYRTAVAFRGTVLAAGAARIAGDLQAVVDELRTDGSAVVRRLVVDLAPETVLWSMAASDELVALSGVAYDGADELAWMGVWGRDGTPRWTTTWQVPDGEFWQSEVLLSDGRPVGVVAVDDGRSTELRFLSLVGAGPRQVASATLDTGLNELSGAWWSGTPVVAVALGYIDSRVHLFPVRRDGSPGPATERRVVNDADLDVGRLRDGTPVFAYSVAGFEPLVFVESGSDARTFLVVDESEIPMTVVSVVGVPHDGSIVLALEEGLGAASVVTLRRAVGDGMGRFVDDEDSIHRAAIDVLAARGWTRGCDPPFEVAFCPRDEVTRGQAAAFLRRALRLPGSDVDRFVDDDGSTFESDIDALAAAGVLRGCDPPTNQRVCPHDAITRGEVAAVLRRALRLPAGAVDRFVDDDGSTFEQDIDALAAAGITRGCGDPAAARFCPDRPLTRGELASLLVRALP